MGRKITTTALAFLLASNSFADTNLTATQKATATLTSYCSISATDINFGEISASSSAQLGVFQNLGSGNVALLCSNRLAYSISINFGTGGSGRWMTGAIYAQKIGYGICATSVLNPQKTDCVDKWYQYGATNYAVNDVGNGGIQNHITYGIVPRGFYTPDNYSDTVTATVNF